MKKLFLLASIVACLGVPWANATVEIRILNLTGPSTPINDTGWIQCSDPSCFFAGKVGNYDLTSDITFKSNTNNPLLDMAYSASTTNANAGTIIIEAMADGYTVNTPQYEMVASGNSTIHTLSNTVAIYGGSNDSICPGSNANPPGPVSSCSPGSVTNLIASSTYSTPPNLYAVDLFGPGNSVNPYSLGVSFTLANPTSAGTASGDIQLDAVPEPAGVALFGGILLFTMTAIRRKMRHSS